MATGLYLKIVTPEGIHWEGEVSSVTLPGREGEMGILPGHIALATQIVAGELTVQQDGKTLFLAVGDGFVVVTSSKVIVLTDMAVSAADIDEAQVELAKKQAEARLQQKLSDEEIAAAQSALAQSIALLRIKKSRTR
ncbi:MAG: ATP synthase F1 subunit epsilon [Verrucomicrobia bacterium]|nr:ATP synthase F1 subunit epsilon [Verrucomicrobiota bacterium]